MQNKQTLLNLVDRAERGVLLPGEAQILREAIEMLDDMCMCVDSVMTRETAREVHRGYDSSTTQTFRAIDVQIGHNPVPYYDEGVERDCG